MSELDRDNAKTIDDAETDSIEEIEEDTDENVQVAEMTDRSSFQTQLRAFFELFIVVREQLRLKIIDDEKWEQTNDLWKFIYKKPPFRNYQTVQEIYKHMKKITTGIAWDNKNAEALEHAVFDVPKVSKNHLEKMCQVTGVKYNLKEKEIDFYLLLDNLIDLGIKGAEFICKKIDAYYELLDVPENLHDNIDDLEHIVSKVNTRRKTKRDAKILVSNYTTNVALWNTTINKAVIQSNRSK